MALTKSCLKMLEEFDQKFSTKKTLPCTHWTNTPFLDWGKRLITAQNWRQKLLVENKTIQAQTEIDPLHLHIDQRLTGPCD